MQFISALLGRGGDLCSEHGKQAVEVCFEPKCQKDHFLCKHENCQRRHKNHRVGAYLTFKESLGQFQKHVALRDQLSASLDRYQSAITAHTDRLF